MKNKNRVYIRDCLFSSDCGDPGTPTSGQRSLSSTTYNSVVTYTCDVGYTLQGSNSRKCLYTGQWKGSVPWCNGVFQQSIYMLGPFVACTMICSMCYIGSPNICRLLVQVFNYCMLYTRIAPVAMGNRWLYSNFIMYKTPLQCIITLHIV